MQEGYVIVEGPQRISYSSLAGGERPQRLWLRCRLAEGRYPQEREPRISMLAPNTVPTII